MTTTVVEMIPRQRGGTVVWTMPRPRFRLVGRILFAALLPMLVVVGFMAPLVVGSYVDSAVGVPVSWPAFAALTVLVAMGGRR